MPRHGDIPSSDPTRLHPPFIVSATDPGAVGEGKCWFNETTTELFIRDSTNTSWISLFGSSFYTIPYLIGDGVTAITTGMKGGLRVDVPGTIVEVTLLSLNNVTGSIVVDIWKDTYANFPPTVADTITASAKPTISAGVKSQDATLTGWTTSIAAGNILLFNVDSASSVSMVGLYLKVQKT